MTSHSQLSPHELEDLVLASLKGRDGAATAGDVAADTGLSAADVESTLRRMLSTYKSHLDVDDDGNLRYRFDKGFVRRGEDASRFWYDLRNTLYGAFKWVFKVWIMVTLVGYTVVFLLLLVAMAIAGIAASASSDSDGDGLIELPFYLLARTLEWLFWIDLFDGGQSRRRRARRRAARRKKARPEKAFYQKVFDYVFGPEKKSDPLKAQAAFTAFVRELNGRVTAADWSARTGQSLDAADSALTGAVVRFNGDVDVADDGTLIYRFDELLVTAAGGGARARGPAKVWATQPNAPSFTGNPGGTNFWITMFNGFNLFMAFAVMSFAGDAASQGVTVDPGILFGLGVIPLVFSVIFWGIPLVRWLGHLRKQSAARKEWSRRAEIKRIFDSVSASQAEPIQLKPATAKVLAAQFEADVRVDNSGNTFYVFDRLKEQLDAGVRARESAGEVVFGETIFSSDEEELSLEQAELDDFDARLARELAGSHVELELGVPEMVRVN